MSLTSKLFEGKLSPQDFITAAAADIKKDIGFFQAIPGVPLFEQWVIGALEAVLLSKLSATTVDLIVGGIRSILGLDTPHPT